MQNWAKHMQCPRDKQTQRSSNRWKSSGKLWTSRSKSCRQRTKKTWHRQHLLASVNQMGSDWLAANFHAREAGAHQHWKKVCIGLLGRAAEDGSAAEQEANRPTLFVVSTTEPAKRKGKGQEHGGLPLWAIIELGLCLMAWMLLTQICSAHIGDNVMSPEGDLKVRQDKKRADPGQWSSTGGSQMCKKWLSSRKEGQHESIWEIGDESHDHKVFRKEARAVHKQKGRQREEEQGKTEVSQRGKFSQMNLDHHGVLGESRGHERSRGAESGALAT